MSSIIEKPSRPMNLISFDPLQTHTSVEGVGNESLFVRDQIQGILTHWEKAITLSGSTDFTWVQSALDLFPGICGLTQTEADRYEESLNTLFKANGKKTGRKFFQ